MAAFDWESPLPSGGNVIGKVDLAASTPQLFTVTMTVADTEYSQVLPLGCRRFELQCRGAFDCRIAYVTGKVAGSTNPFWTLKSARSDDSGPISQAIGSVTPITVYFASSASPAGQIMEIRAWT